MRVRILVVGAVAGLASLAVVQSPHNARSAAAAECTGEYRWNIKTLSDPNAGDVRLTPVKAGVADLWDKAKPAGFKSKVRNPPFETTTYRIKAKLVKARRIVWPTVRFRRRF